MNTEKLTSFVREVLLDNEVPLALREKALDLLIENSGGENGKVHLIGDFNAQWADYFY